VANTPLLGQNAPGSWRVGRPKPSRTFSAASAYATRKRSGIAEHETRRRSSLGHSYVFAFASPRSGPRMPSAGSSRRMRRSRRFALTRVLRSVVTIVQAFDAVFHV